MEYTTKSRIPYEDGEIKDSTSQRFMSKKMRKEQMIKKITTSFVNKSQKWVKDNNHSIKRIKEEKKDALNRACQECINNGIFELQNLDDWNRHTKSNCPQRGLHLVIHNYKWKNGQRGYEKSYTIIEDKRFYYSESDAYYPLRVELIPKKDKIRNTIAYTVLKNESGLQEDYEIFYKRHKLEMKTYSSTKELLEISKKMEFGNFIP